MITDRPERGDPLLFGYGTLACAVSEQRGDREADALFTG
jgi:hypothetical protein